jgi:hypothetical protein
MYETSNRERDSKIHNESRRSDSVVVSACLKTGSPAWPGGVLLSECLKVNRNGFIKFHRVIQDHPIKKDHACFLLFFDLLADAEWKPGASVFFKGKEIKLQRGQLTRGRNQLAQSTGLPPSTVRNALKRLQSKWQIVDIKKDSQYSLITISNYNRYQCDDIKQDSKKDTGRTGTGQEVDTFEELKNVRTKEIKKEMVCFAPPTLNQAKDFFNDEQAAQDFHDYYESNGWKVGGRAPMKNWQAAARRWQRTNFKKHGENLTKGQQRTAASYEEFKKRREYEKSTGTTLPIGYENSTVV